MISRHAVMALMMAGAVGIPYLTSSKSKIHSAVWGLCSSEKPADGDGSGTGADDGGAAGDSIGATATTPTQLTGYPSGSLADGQTYPGFSPSAGVRAVPISSQAPAGQSASGTSAAQSASGKANQPAAGKAKPQQKDLTEVLRFDVTPQWIMSRWPRVTTGLAEMNLQGYRVPLVSGTDQSDLAGSLTYYFDKDQKVERLIFHGTSGDPRKLVSLLTSKFEFKREATDDAGLYLYMVKWNGRPYSELRIRPARVLRADAPNSRYEVDLALRRP